MAKRIKKAAEAKKAAAAKPFTVTVDTYYRCEVSVWWPGSCNVEATPAPKAATKFLKELQARLDGWTFTVSPGEGCLIVTGDVNDDDPTDTVQEAVDALLAEQQK